MAKKELKEGAKPQASAEKGEEPVKQAEESQKASMSSYNTTAGNVLDKVSVDLPKKSGFIVVKAHYGQLNPEGKNAEEKRARMAELDPRPLTAAQAREYLRLREEDPKKAVDYAVSSALAMYLDDKTFNNEIAVVGGKEVNFIFVDRVTKDTVASDYAFRNNMSVEEAKTAIAALPEKEREALEAFVGKYRMNYGVKGESGWIDRHILTPDEASSYFKRADVTTELETRKGSNGREYQKRVVKTWGSPISKAQLADKVAQRIAVRDTQRSAREAEKTARLEAAKKVDWGKFKLPEGADVQNLRFFESKNDPNKVVLQGFVNGVKITSELSYNETAALRGKLATLTQLAVANKGFREKMNTILQMKNSPSVSEGDAVKVIIDRASDKNAKAFTPDQVKILNAYAGDSQDKGGVFVSLFEKAKPELDSAGVNAKWQEDARAELQELAEGKTRDQSQGMHR